VRLTDAAGAACARRRRRCRHSVRLSHCSLCKNTQSLPRRLFRPRTPLIAAPLIAAPLIAAPLIAAPLIAAPLSQFRSLCDTSDA
jgi:hypothetical protein